MKKYLMILGGFTGILFLFTVIPARFSAQPDHAAEYSAATPVTTLSAEESAAAPESEPDKAALCETYRMLDITSGKVEEISVRDYVIGAVCAEMPATFEPDALKAQAVAAHTYAERQHLLESASPTAALCGADFSNDSSQYQAYFTENQARQYYGDNFETAYAKVTQAVDDVLPYVLEYDGAPIIAAFCSMSAGVTESAENIWAARWNIWFRWRARRTPLPRAIWKRRSSPETSSRRRCSPCCPVQSGKRTWRNGCRSEQVPRPGLCWK